MYGTNCTVLQCPRYNTTKRGIHNVKADFYEANNSLKRKRRKSRNHSDFSAQQKKSNQSKCEKSICRVLP